MEPSDTILPTLFSYLVQFPILLVWLAGFILAIAYWRRHPRASLLTVIALVIFLLESVVNTYLNLWLPLMLSERGIATFQMSQILVVKGIVTSIILAVAWGLLIAAIFGGRQAAATEN